MDKSVDGVDKSLRAFTRESVLGVYAKQPLPGRVKTRLCPPLTPVEAAGLYDCALRETVARLRAQQSFDLALCYAGDPDWFAAVFPDLPLLPQRGEDLGARMRDSFECLFRLGYRQVVLVGSDTPDLPLALVEEAFACLQQAEVVLAPARDGGYVLIGKTESRPELFEAMRWSSPEVLPETLRRLELLGCRAALLPDWEDLDDLPALERLLRRSPQSRTAAYLCRQLAHHFSGGRQA